GHWCYQSQKHELPNCEDPRKWHLITTTCKGSKQSPINIVTKNVIYDSSLKPLNFEGYDVKGPSKWNLENNGHTVKATLSTSPKIGGGGLRRKYKAIELHFHWGVQDIHYLPGSEHSINGEKAAMELHIVHIREDLSDITEAKKNEDGVAVLAFFIEVGSQIFNCCLKPASTSNLSQDWTVCVTVVQDLNFPDFYKYDLAKYYRYTGSLTTPDCHEDVIWTVFEKPVELSLAQVSQFSMVHFGDKNSTNMVENFRPVQLLNARSVFWSGTSPLLPPAKVLMLVPILTYVLSSLFQ
uniref:Carbonic anhydrase 4 n=1 Tax=Apteryx owenii TaxID=8824 RepID=A0A8B9S8V0_APTOW